jgi:alpha-soluble NSF attachment protein
MKSSPQEGVGMLRQAVDLYTDMGRLNMAARQLREIAEAQEKAGAKQEACAFYEQAADLFATENATSEANRCRLKVAEFSAELDDYSRAGSLFEEVASAAAENNLLKYSAKGHLLCAGICALCHLSDEEISTKFERYRDVDLQFAGSRECTLLEGCAAALAASDDKAFSQAVAEFDSMTRLDGWKTAMLLRVKRRIGARQTGEEKGADDDDEVL